MSRIVALLVLALALVGASPAAAEDEGTIYQRYSDIRSELYSCQLTAVSNNQTAEDKADCRRLQRHYVLYASPGEGYFLHVHCRSPRRCIATPVGEPPANGPIPAGATVYDVKVSQKVVRRKKKARRKKARSRRSRAARGSAAAVR